jgi:hypothetical protein
VAYRYNEANAALRLRKKQRLFKHVRPAFIMHINSQKYLECFKDIWNVSFMFNVKNKETPENMANMFSLSNNEKYELKKERH